MEARGLKAGRTCLSSDKVRGVCRLRWSTDKRGLPSFKSLSVHLVYPTFADPTDRCLHGDFPHNQPSGTLGQFSLLTEVLLICSRNSHAFVQMHCQPTSVMSTGTFLQPLLTCTPNAYDQFCACPWGEALRRPPPERGPSTLLRPPNMTDSHPQHHPGTLRMMSEQVLSHFMSQSSSHIP